MHCYWELLRFVLDTEREISSAELAGADEVWQLGFTRGKGIPLEVGGETMFRTNLLNTSWEVQAREVYLSEGKGFRGRGRGMKFYTLPLPLVNPSGNTSPIEDGRQEVYSRSKGLGLSGTYEIPMHPHDCEVQGPPELKSESIGPTFKRNGPELSSQQPIS
ncbi:hypothetical protein FB451DRAFT_1178602 [Mycena latifolia]|nr:hypothetical protein FB451DRAFT_1178602 [Mycena latifolia]